ncbi:MAG: transcriptional regulator [Lapillicoccus sp.]
MPVVVSDQATLTLHAVRLLGFADTASVASRFRQVVEEARERLLDFEAVGWVSHSEFGTTSGWSMTASGRAEGQRRLASELHRDDLRFVVAAMHRQFLILNARFLEAATRWQVRTSPSSTMTPNDHNDLRWDSRVIEELGLLGGRLRPLNAEVAAVLTRFDGYADRYDVAFQKASRGENRWVTGVGIDSCHVVWMQLHEDLLATLGLERGQEI